MNKQRKLISVLLMLSMILSMVMFAGCSSKYTSPGKDKDALVVTIGKDKIYMDTLKPYIADTEISTEYYNQMYKQYDAEYNIWSEKDADGVENAVGLRNEVLKNFEEVYIINKEAEGDDKYNIPKKDLKKIKANSKKLVKTFSDKMIKKTGFKSDSFVEMQKMKYVYDKYSFKVKADDVKADYDYDNIYRQYTTSYLYIATTSTDESGNQTVMSEEEKKAAKETMQKAYDMLKDGKTAEEIVKKYPEITNEEKTYTQKDAYPDKVPGTKEDDKDKKAQDAENEPDAYTEKTKKLANNEYTEVFDYAGNYAIGIMKDNNSKEAYDAAIEQGITEKENKLFEKKIKELKKTDKYKIKVNREVWHSFKLGDVTIIQDEFNKASGHLKKKGGNQ